MAWFETPEGEICEAFDAMADLYLRRGWKPVDPPTEPDEPDGRPSPTASRKAWAAYAAQLGYEVEDMTRAQIIAALDTVEGA